MADDKLNIQAQVSGTEKVQRDLGGIADAERKVGKEATDAGRDATRGHETAGTAAEKHGRKLGGVGKLLKGLADEAKGFIAGFAGLAVVQKGLDMMLQRLEAIRAAMRQIAQEASGGQASVHQLAVQLGDVSQGGFDTAEGIATQVRRAGGFSDMGTASSMAIAMDVALGSRGGIAQNMGTAREVAGVAGALNMQAGEAGKLVELLGTMGALESPEDMQGALAKTRAAFTASRATSFGQFATMLQQGGTGMLTQGVDTERMLEWAVQFRQVAVNEAQAGTMMEQFQRVALGQSGGEATRDYLKSAAAGQGTDWVTMSAQGKMEFLQGLIQGARTPQEQQALMEILPGEVSGRLFSAFSGKNLAETASASGAIASATAADTVRARQQWQSTTLYAERVGQAGRESRSIREGDLSRFFGELEKSARHDYMLAMGRGDVGVESEEAFTERRMVEMVAEAIENRLRRARESGDTETVEAMEGLQTYRGVQLEQSRFGLAGGRMYGYSDTALRRWMDMAVMSGITVNQIGTNINQGEKGNVNRKTGPTPSQGGI